ncbi:hypothetical protein JCM16358_24440 [Halanaerocella petrolearia]
MEERIIDYLKDQIDYQQVIGEPYQVEDMTLIPILDILVGGGGGTNASGGGAYLTPKAVVIIKPQGEVSFLPLQDDCSKEQIVEEFPEVIEKIEVIN